MNPSSVCDKVPGELTSPGAETDVTAMILSVEGKKSNPPLALLPENGMLLASEICGFP